MNFLEAYARNPEERVEDNHSINKKIYEHVFLKPSEPDDKPIKDKLTQVEGLVRKGSCFSEVQENQKKCIELNKEIHTLLLYAMHSRDMLIPKKERWITGTVVKTPDKPKGVSWEP